MSEDAGPPRAPGIVRAAAERLSWGVADQAVSSLTNFAVGIVVARELGAVEFGAFSLAWVTFSVVMNLSRGVATDPLAVRFSGVPVARWRTAVSRSASVALLVGLVSGALCLVVGLLLGGPVGAAFAALGLVLPALLLQDCWRFAFFAAGAGNRAFLNDLVWAIALIPAMYLASMWGTVFAFVLAWGASGAVAAVFGCLQTRLRPAGPAGVMTWVREQSDLGLRYMVENVSVGVAAQLRMYGLGAIAGLADVGAVRGAQLLLGPFLAVLIGLSSVAVPEAARVLQRSARRLPQFCLLFGGVQAAAGALWGLALLVALPDSIGEFLLGSVWPSAFALVVPTTLVVVGGSLTDGPKAGLRALGAARRSLRAQLFSAIAYVVGGIAGAMLDGAAGSAWGVAIATLLSAAVTWWQLHTALREHVSRPSVTISPAAP